jgi:hypothetical protein
MSLHRTAGATLVTAALLIVPAGASARPAEPTETGAAAVSATPVRAEAPAVLQRDAGSGTDALTVLAVAGGTLLAGAVGGVAGGQVLARRHALRP